MRRFALVVLCAVVCATTPVRAARPLLDRHQWDAYFALYARDAAVPWKNATVRLDTYSGAPLDFTAYEVDPADVIVAGANRAPRPIDTSHRTSVARWKFAPQPGYRFETNDVAVPLGTREGFFVIEARRGDAVQQVWINRTHLGLLTKESPEGLVAWCVDLRGGRALANVSVAFLVGTALVNKRTDRNGLIVWRDRTRPAFALAESGSARAFVSILPQAPVPLAIVGLRLDRAVVRAGDRIRYVGFARKRDLGIFGRANGDARITLAGRGRTLASGSARLDAAGAFSGELTVPAGVEAGDYAVLADAAGGVGGTSVHIDAATDIALSLRALCPCDAERDIVVSVAARRGEIGVPDVPLHVVVVRTPHVVPPGSPDDAVRWGTTLVAEQTVRTGADGDARLTISVPSDGLDSTYGVRASARGATATSRIVVANARIALAVAPVSATADVGEPIAVEIRGFNPSDGTPANGIGVDVRLSHGASLQLQHAILDARGHARVVFKGASSGSNLIVAQADLDGRKALDAAAVVVEPRVLSGRTASTQNAVIVTLDRPRYRPHATIVVRANAPGASGDALVTLEGARTYETRRANVVDGNAQVSFDLGDAQGAVRVTAAFVRDGAIALGSSDVHIDGPGHARLTELRLDKNAYAAGEMLHVTLRDGDARSASTIAVRIADGRESGPALFDDAADLLGTGATSAQTPASDDPQWHAYVAPARSKATDIFAAERPRQVATDTPSIGVAAPRTQLWRVARDRDAPLDVAAPRERGHYVISIMRIADDGDVGAASASFNVL